MPSKTDKPAELAVQFWRDVKIFIDASAYSLIALNLGLRKGDAARKAALKPDNEWAAEIEYWFEIGVTFHPVYKELDGPAKAALAAFLIKALKDFLTSIRL